MEEIEAKTEVPIGIEEIQEILEIQEITVMIEIEAKGIETIVMIETEIVETIVVEVEVLKEALVISEVIVVEMIDLIGGHQAGPQEGQISGEILIIEVDHQNGEVGLIKTLEGIVDQVQAIEIGNKIGDHQQGQVQELDTIEPRNEILVSFVVKQIIHCRIVLQ